MRVPFLRRVAALGACLGMALLAASCAVQAQVAWHDTRPGPPAKGGVLLDPASPAPEVAAAPAALAGATAAPTLPATTQALLDEINHRRAEGASCGGERKAPAPPMRWNTLLLRAAESHVRDMAAQRGGIGHTGSNGSTVGARAEGAGYRWTSVGENVAAGRPTASATLAQWMASPGHCANIMNPRFLDVAVAGLHLPGTTYNHYWVMVLGRP
ncbi:MAG: CAP domain-containing protein [Burkholderiales bacterium]|nr:CAP domain-containing protein [Burkholderiales bacterium]